MNDHSKPSRKTAAESCRDNGIGAGGSEPAPVDCPPPTATHSPYADDLLCPDCGYSLRGLTSERCPECGLDLDFIESDQPVIPWERRREIGYARAYWRTAYQAAFRQKLFCRAGYRPVSYACARKFHWLSIGHAYVALLLVLGTLQLTEAGLLVELAEETSWWFVGFAGLCLLPAMAALTGVPSYWFHPRYLSVERQNRSVALSYYCVAPMGYGALPTGIIICIALFVLPPLLELPTDVLIFGGSLVCLGAGFVILLRCYLCWSRLARYASFRFARRLSITCIMPLVSIFVGLLVLVGLCAVAYAIAIVFHSLQPVDLPI